MCEGIDGAGLPFGLSPAPSFTLQTPLSAELMSATKASHENFSSIACTVQVAKENLVPLPQVKSPVRGKTKSAAIDGSASSSRHRLPSKLAMAAPVYGHTF